MFAASKTASASTGGYQISRSLRTNSADTTYLGRTPASSGNRKTWTWSAWVKRSGISTATSCMFGGGTSTTDYAEVYFTGGDVLKFYDFAGSVDVTTTSVYRDVSAWYHIVYAIDTTQATASNRVKMYVNGVQVTSFTTANYPSLNADLYINRANVHSIAALNYTGGIVDYFNGYMTEVNFIDGQALTPSSFGETNAQTGVWQPKAYSGSYGTNGFYLNFSDNSNTTAATLGKDYSGNGNNWTPNNFSVTAGAGNDSLVDSPTSYGVDTGAGGSVRGNYCTMNPLSNSGTLTNGNLDFVANATGASRSIFATLGVSSGKWYWEMTVTTVGNSYYPGLGIETNTAASPDVQSGDSVTGYMYLVSGSKYNGGTLSSYGATYNNGDVIGVALDMDAGTITFYKNNTSQGQAFSGITGTARPVVVGSGSTAGTMNFGQRPFAYTAPSGFKALCTQNLPTPTIGATTATQAGKYFNPVLYTGNGSTQSVTGVGFQPDLVWGKSRSAATNNNFYDAVRGTGKILVSNNTDAETDVGALGLSAFGSDGFSLGAGSTLNNSGSTYVAWNWKANGSGSTNTSGSITSTVSANTTSGFSVVTFTSQASGAATVGHGLGVAPSMVIVKGRNVAYEWYTYHVSLGASAYVSLSNTAASASSSTLWNATSPTSSVFSLGTAWTGSNTFVAYCFAEVAGYSKFGSYTGNGSTDGAFIYLGFRPRFVMVKQTNAAGNWLIWDTARSNNQMQDYLSPNNSSAELNNSLVSIDALSNGFKCRTSDNDINGSGDTYIYAAFAENPFKYSIAR